MAEEAKNENENEERVYNKYERVILTAMRARELAEGIDVSSEMEGQKITSIAMKELKGGKLRFSEDIEEEETGEAEEAEGEEE